MHPEMRRINDCLAAVRAVTDFVPKVAVVLGSGLGGFAGKIERVAAVPYAGFPVCPAPPLPAMWGSSCSAMWSRPRWWLCRDGCTSTRAMTPATWCCPPG